MAEKRTARPVFPAKAANPRRMPIPRPADDFDDFRQSVHTEGGFARKCCPSLIIEACQTSRRRLVLAEPAGLPHRRSGSHDRCGVPAGVGRDGAYWQPEANGR
jgi:hypothetical protein